ncbi:MAG: glutaredoxin domain-containing protein [Candidatus Paceibacterota bacterium]
MNKNIIVGIVVIVAFFAGVVFWGFASEEIQDNGSEKDQEENESMPDEENEENKDELQTSDLKELVACLDDAGVVIYGSRTCPYCSQLVESFGGRDIVDSIYVECSDEPERCQEELIGKGVPEIQIDGEMYRESRDPKVIGEAANCQI